MNENKTPNIDKAEKTGAELVVNNNSPDWVNNGSFEGMMEIATKMVTSSLIPFRKPEDAVMAWQFGRDIGLTFTQSMTELYAIPSNGVTRITAGVHIHEAILLKNNVRYEVVEDAVEIQYYKIKGLGTVILSMEQMMKRVEEGLYQVVTADEFDENGLFLNEKTGKYLAMSYQCPYLADGFEDVRTSIRFIRKDKDIDAIVSYRLSDAVKAGLMAKDNWMKNPNQMLYTAGFRIGSRRYASDLLKNLGELTETLHYSNVPHTVADDSKVTFETEYEDVTIEEEEIVETETIELAVDDVPIEE